MKLKKWIMNTGFTPDSESVGIDAYQGIKTSFEMTIDEFAQVVGSSKKSLKTPVKDKNGDTVMIGRFPKLRIMEYFDEVQKVNCKINSQYVSGSFQPLPSVMYNKEDETVRLGTTTEMAVILQDEAFAKNLSFVDMQLQLSLNSVMASHILDRISRFKEYKRDYQCTVGDLIDQCGLDADAMSNRSNFIMVNLKRPLKQIEDKSNGTWERIGTGVTVTAKKRGTLLREDEIVFKMKYHAPKAEKIAAPLTTKQQILALVDKEPSNINAMIAKGILEAIETHTANLEQIKAFATTLEALNLSVDMQIDQAVTDCLEAIERQNTAD